jgi:hypothetical protein
MKSICKFHLAGLFFILAGFNLSCQIKSEKSSDKFQIKLENFPDSKKVDITVDGKLFTSYLYSDTLKKPVLFPVVAVDGISVTRGFPLAPKEGEPIDHPHHTGFWFNYGYVNGIDFWGNSSWILANDKMKYGNIRLKSIDKIESFTDKAILEVTQEWVNPDGTVPIEEHVTFIFQAGKDYRIIDRITILTAKINDLAMNDTKEGAFAIRVARFLEMPSTETKVFLDASGKPTTIPVINNDGVSGNYLSSEGLEGEKAWGTRAKWMELFGISGSDTVSIVFMDHPRNLNYPSFWHARGYGLFSANPFGQKDFTGGKEELNFTLKKDESLIFRHRLYIRSGNSINRSEIEEMWMDFSKN